jgi:hypothetical protein
MLNLKSLLSVFANRAGRDITVTVCLPRDLSDRRPDVIFISTTTAANHVTAALESRPQPLPSPST